jgi:regulation of enolase protein 1 (concanavalin A-like superfamily)
MEWLNEPPNWSQSGDTLHVKSGAKTDFWRKTHADFIADNGHFYYQPVEGDFTAEVKVTGSYTDQYDQAGLMVRIDSETWIKCGIELLDGIQRASTVVTREFSDWSLVTLAITPPELRLRVKRYKHTIEVDFSSNGASYVMLRQAYFPTGQANVGIMCAAPTGGGFEAQFAGLMITVSS